ncbi:MAG: phosphatase PAP2 family protein [Prevotellaceae bacterium]|jgi:membrane-associated phospholipid phosphatase|nr:phosphatase PAP2 family protein [Prevotellaceae bacterium]
MRVVFSLILYVSIGLFGSIEASLAEGKDTSGFLSGKPEWSYKNSDNSMYKFSFKESVAPMCIVTFGIVTLNFDWGDELDKKIQKTLQDNPWRTNVDDYIQYAPAFTSLALDAVAVYGKHNTVEKAIILATSYAIEATVVNSMKYTFRVRRPGKGSYNSFPSGHTATAFVGAEFLRKEYWDVSPWYGVGGYTVAIATGYLRVQNNRHWFNDVITGAGIAILSVHAAYYIYPYMRKFIFLEKIKKMNANAMIMPYYFDKQMGLALVAYF